MTQYWLITQMVVLRRFLGLGFSKNDPPPHIRHPSLGSHIQSDWWYVMKLHRARQRAQ